MEFIIHDKQHQSSSQKSIKKSLEVENSDQINKHNNELKKSSYHPDHNKSLKGQEIYGIFTNHGSNYNNNDEDNNNNENNIQDEIEYEYDQQQELLHNYGPGASSLQGLEDKGYQRIFTPAGSGRKALSFRNHTTSGLSTSGTIQTSSRRKTLSTNNNNNNNHNNSSNNNNSKPNGMSMLSVLQGSNSNYLSATSKICISHDAEESNMENKNWEYPGWGTVYEKKFEAYELPVKPKKHQLDVYRSTAIAGNDLLASVLYTTGLVCLACGQLAPFSMFLCCLALYPFRKIFQECGTALPLNGGVYVVMLNATTKLTATITASCSLISYSATAVVSAASCTSYAAGEFGQFEVLPVTVAILAAFGFLVFFGVKDSANLALMIFSFHLLTLMILIIASFITIIQNHGEVWIYNWSQPLPPSSGGVGMNLYLGFSVALLGLTGFETSANYIEEAGPFETENKYKHRNSGSGGDNSSRSDRSNSIGNDNNNNRNNNRNNSNGHDDDGNNHNHDHNTTINNNNNNNNTNSSNNKTTHNMNNSHHSNTSSNRSINHHTTSILPGSRPISVFERTIDNMWWLVILINPAIAISTLGVLKLDIIVNHVPNILSYVGQEAGGSWLRTLVSIDAVFVLSAGVLTAYVGVVGLIKQLASDRCLPIFLLHIHSYTHTNHYIIFSFFLLCSILYLITNGDVVILSGVFSVAFLMVLISFATANLLLKIRRPKLPRGAHSSWTGTVLGFLFMSLGLIGNIIFNIYLLVYFIIYFIFYSTIIVSTFQRIKLTKQFLFLIKLSPHLDAYFSPYIYRALIEMRKHTVIFFTKTSELHILNKAILYAHDNCLCDRLIIIHVIVPDRQVDGEVVVEAEIRESTAVDVGEKVVSTTCNGNNNNNNDDDDDDEVIIALNEVNVMSKDGQSRNNHYNSSNNHNNRNSHNNNNNSSSSSNNSSNTNHTTTTPTTTITPIRRPPHDLNITTNNTNNTTTNNNDDDDDDDDGYTPSRFPERLGTQNNNHITTPSIINHHHHSSSSSNSSNSSSCYSNNDTNVHINESSSSSFSSSSSSSSSVGKISESSIYTNNKNTNSHTTNPTNSNTNAVPPLTTTTIPSIKSQLKLNFSSSFTPSSSSSIATINQLRENLKVLDHVYPKVKIDLLLVTAPEFNPSLVAKLSEDLNIRPSFMFIRCPCENFKYNLGEFEGVRTIMK